MRHRFGNDKSNTGSTAMFILLILLVLGGIAGVVVWQWPAISKQLGIGGENTNTPGSGKAATGSNILKVGDKFTLKSGDSGWGVLYLQRDGSATTTKIKSTVTEGDASTFYICSCNDSHKKGDQVKTQTSYSLQVDSECSTGGRVTKDVLRCSGGGMCTCSIDITYNANNQGCDTDDWDAIQLIKTTATANSSGDDTISFGDEVNIYANAAKAYVCAGGSSEVLCNCSESTYAYAKWTIQPASS